MPSTNNELDAHVDFLIQIISEFFRASANGSYNPAHALSLYYAVLDLKALREGTAA